MSLEYNNNCIETQRMLQDLYMVLDNIKEGIHKKEFPVYTSLLQQLHHITAINLNIFKNELVKFKENDSDNENSYDEDIRDIPNDKSNDINVDSVSEYETDSEDEEFKESEILLQKYDKKCEELMKLIKSEYICEI